ncbi:Na+/H+ antiporter [Chryseobacterium indologenes]|uniref:Na+/H+ antiporter n=2 Tax=Chryseobacterium indologenes TaxID=253 RepID=UPI000F512099|nr:Na+/H+ antiporter [Chryseobacterium indologenes]AYZ37121.1 Na+/H+ antiporter [Chryseobacterium indologenes]MBF6645970.1 Na+/H+ antiporter [Chryseobacterium indologenes]MEB4761017.1 Na+/H+ antiporter [Chryseobacterium indologenes]QQQ70370.1 Na+/H+ antiporter [Chryseobacterium indologenes]
MVENFIYYLGLVLVIIGSIMLANRLKVAYPIILVIAGLLISFIPGLPVIKIDPELIFIIFLPPLLYEAAFAVSWKEIWKLRRVITSFAFIVVFLTAISVAFVANYYIPGFSLALGFVLGGIVSPPDAVSAGAILKFVKVPKNVSTVLEGESLFNDASSLIIFRFAMVAVATGQFLWQDALASFGWMIFGGLGIGVLLAYIFLKIEKIFPTDVNMDAILSLVAPYVMYIAAEEVHASGVLAVVSGGLFLSVRRHEIFRTPESRLKGSNVWESFVFLINGIVFLLIGLDLPEIMVGLRKEGVSFSDAVNYSMVITAVLIVVRFLASFGAVFTTMIMRNYINVADRSPGMKLPVLMGWTGMRGVVSLAAALSIPVLMDNGQPFPHRDLILFITFVVILVTLILQGLTLPALIRKLNLSDSGGRYWSKEESEHFLRREMRRVALHYLNENYRERRAENEYFNRMLDRWEKEDKEDSIHKMSDEGKKIYFEALEQQRIWLREENRRNMNIDEEYIRHYLTRLDMEEERVRM